MLKTSLVITGDTSGAVKQVETLAASVDTLGRGAKSAAAPMADLSKAQIDGAASGRTLAGAQEKVTTAQAATATSTRDLAQSLKAAQSAQVSAVAEIGRSATAHAAASVAAGASAAANDNVARSAGTAGTANIVLQSIIRKTVDQYAAGASIGTIFGEHIESLVEILELYARSGAQSVEATKQVGSANAEAGNSVGELGKTVVEGAEKFTGFKGVVGVAAEFLAGPWGIAVSIAAAALPSLIGGLLETESASDGAKDALQHLADAQANLANAVSKTNGKLAEQNRLQALAGSIAAPTSIRQGLQVVGTNIRDGFDAARSTLSSLPGSGRNPSGDRLALNRLLLQAGGGLNDGSGNLAVLTKGVNDLASSSNDKAVHDLADTLNTLYSSGARALQSTKALEGAQRDANTVLAGGSVLTSEVVARQVQLATAHDGVTRAQARLAVAQGELNRLFDQPSSDARDKAIAKARDAVIADTNTVKALQEASKKTRTPRVAKPADTTSLSAGVANDVASLTAQFTDAPTFVEKARAAVAKLEKDITELQKKKPPNFQPLVDQARAAQGVIQGNLTKPLDDYIKGQNASLGILKLQAAGLTDQAAAQEQINALEKQQGTLNAGQRDAVLATVQAIRAEQREIQVRNELNAKYLTEIGSIKSAVEDATQAFVRGDLGQFIKTPGKLIDAFQTLEGQQLFDKMFSGAFRDLQDQVNGTSVAKDAAKRFALAVDDVTARSKATADAVQAFRSPVEDATKALGGFTAALQGAASSVGGSAGANAQQLAQGGSITDPSLVSLLGKGNGVTGPSLTSLLGRGNNTDNSLSVPGDIVVTANRLAKPDAPVAKPDYLVAGFQKIATSITGLFTNHDSAATIGASIGKYAGKGLEGAATGTLVAGIGKTLGINLSQSGAQIGGTVGGILGSISAVTSALPGIGAALGPVLSVVGGLVGKLFAPKAQPGGATVSAVNGSAGVSGTVGSDAAGIKAGNSLGTSVSSGINQIAQQLGGTIGAFNVEIGKYKDDLRVNVNGKALGGVKGSGAVGFGDDESAAVSYAISQAIAQGAVAGLDAPVRKALGSSTDTQKALQEALGVKNLEVLLGGVQASIKATFDAEAASAKERLRLARTYGLDVAAVEKTNADQLAKVVASTLKQQVGSLQTLVTDLTSGSLFEGTALDKIAALNTQITKAKADLDAGVDGAGDTLAKLYQDRLSASKDAYGTTSGYAADRTDTLDAARAAIAAANARITKASADTSSDPALATTNAALDENNDQNAQILSALQQNNTLLSAIAKTGNSAPMFDLSRLASV